MSLGSGLLSVRWPKYTPIQMNLQSQAKKFENRKGRSFSSPSIPRMFEILQGCTLARIMFLEKKKQAILCEARQATEKHEDRRPPAAASKSKQKVESQRRKVAFLARTPDLLRQVSGINRELFRRNSELFCAEQAELFASTGRSIAHCALPTALCFCRPLPPLQAQSPSVQRKRHRNVAFWVESRQPDRVPP